MLQKISILIVAVILNFLFINNKDFNTMSK